jgi:hypothetical protein
MRCKYEWSLGFNILPCIIFKIIVCSLNISMIKSSNISTPIMIAKIFPVVLLATQAVNDAVVSQHTEDTVASSIQPSCVVVTVTNYITVPAVFVSTSNARIPPKSTVLITQTDFVTIQPPVVPSVTKSQTSSEEYLTYGPGSSSGKSIVDGSSCSILVPKQRKSSISLKPEISRVSVPVIRSSTSNVNPISSIIPRSTTSLNRFIYPQISSTAVTSSVASTSSNHAVAPSSVVLSSSSTMVTKTVFKPIFSQKIPAATSANVPSSSSAQVTKTNFAPLESLRIPENTIENPLDGGTSLNRDHISTNPSTEMPAHTTAVVVVPIYPSFVPTITSGILLRDAGRNENSDVYGPGILIREAEPIKRANIGGNTENPQIHGLDAEPLKKANTGRNTESLRIYDREAKAPIHANPENLRINHHEANAKAPIHGNTENPRIHGRDAEAEALKKANIGGNTENPGLDGRSVPDIELNLNIVDPVFPSVKPTSTPHASPTTKISTRAPSQVTQPPNSKPKPSTTNKSKSTPPATTPGPVPAPHWPYPYPGEGKAMSFKTMTKKASETGKAKTKSTGWCPYPGQNC